MSAGDEASVAIDGDGCVKVEPSRLSGAVSNISVEGAATVGGRQGVPVKAGMQEGAVRETWDVNQHSFILSAFPCEQPEDEGEKV